MMNPVATVTRSSPENSHSDCQMHMTYNIYKDRSDVFCTLQVSSGTHVSASITGCAFSPDELRKLADQLEDAINRVKS